MNVAFLFKLGQNHIDARCLMIMLEALSKVDQITLEELDLTVWKKEILIERWNLIFLGFDNK